MTLALVDLEDPVDVAEDDDDGCGCDICEPQLIRFGPYVKLVKNPRYACLSCNRAVPWCFGAADAYPEHCDDCWNVMQYEWRGHPTRAEWHLVDPFNPPGSGSVARVVKPRRLGRWHVYAGGELVAVTWWLWRARRLARWALLP
jgi:hypothetical protein